ncbi:MAG: hypothetical protein ACOCP4_03475 [Candidatus Woesearchaeota archaeon]
MNPEATEAVCDYLKWRNSIPVHIKDGKQETVKGKKREILYEKRRWESHSD